METHIYPAFAVPLAEVMHPFAERANRELKALLLAREAEGDRYRNPSPSLKQQAGVFESRLDLLSWPEPCIRDLEAFIVSSLGNAIGKLNRYTPEQLQKIEIMSHTWYHVTRHGGFTITHTHPMASWSGVYCVCPGETPEEYPESGVLRFHNPHQYSNMFLDPGNLKLIAPYNHGFWNIKLKPGQLILFPSWVPHEVMPFYGRDERITIAFNSWFKMQE